MVWKKICQIQKIRVRELGFFIVPNFLGNILFLVCPVREGEFIFTVQNKSSVVKPSDCAPGGK